METKKIQFEHNKLLGFFVSQGLSKQDVADILGITKQSLNNKLANRTYFTPLEIDTLQKRFVLSDRQVRLFFYKKVAKAKQ